MNRTIEAYLIFLKEDLKIADTCKNIKNQLLTFITNRDHFSDELVSYFTGQNANIPLSINDTDPTQVVLLKKFINALEHTENGFRALETVDFNPNRYAAGIYKEATQRGTQAIHEIYAAVQLLNHCNADIQTLVGPYLQQLLPQMALAGEALSQFTPEQPEKCTGTVLGGMIQRLPTEKMAESQSLENISHLMSGLPHYFEELQKLIATGASSTASKSATSNKAYQAAMNDRAAQINLYLQKLNKSGDVIPYLGLANKLISYSSELVNTAAPLTKQAYLDAVLKLKKIKHIILPKFIAELEAAEENMSLKPGLFTEPALKQMDQYYSKLATTVEKIAQTAGVIDMVSTDYLDTPSGKLVGYLAGNTQALNVGKELKTDPKLNIMMDDTFAAKRKELQETRLHEARLQAPDISVVEAAVRFFAKINSYGSLYQTTCKWSLANLYQNDKNELFAAYKQFQTQFAALHPDIDKLIVDTLTQNTGNNIVSRLYGSDYKQLISSNHFQQVLNCKESVLRNMGQTRFKAKLIEHTIANEEKLAYARQNQITELHLSTEPFKELQYIEMEKQSVEFYHDKALAVAKQITQIEQAQQGISAFFTKINDVQYRDSTQFTALNDADKEYLRKQYISFQAQLIALGHRDVNNKLVNSLKPSNNTEYSLEFHELKLLQSNITQHLKNSIDRLITAKQTYVAQEQRALNKLHQTWGEGARRADEGMLVRKTALETQSLTLEKQTLFGEIAKHQLSKSLDAFFKDKFQHYLKNALSNIIWRELSSDGQTIDHNKIPFLEFHKDTEEVVMYKQLINAIYYLKLSLEQLETLHAKGDPSTLIYRSRYVLTIFNSLIINIPNSKYYVELAAKNPALKEILTEGWALLEPLKNNPLIGNYLKTKDAEQATIKINIVEEWKKQLELVNSSRLNSPKTKLEEQPAVTVIEKPANANKATTSYIQRIAEGLYKIPVTLGSTPPPQEEIDANIKAFVDDLEGLSIDPDSVKRILNTLSKFQMQVSEIGKVGRELSINYLKEMKAEIGTPLLEAADNTEFHLGLKPGIYSSIVSERFDRFYDNLIASMPLTNENESLDFILDLSSTKIRWQRELNRINTIDRETTTSINHTQNVLFGTDYETFNRWYQPYLDLKHELQSAPSFAELQSALTKIYKTIQPELAKINSHVFNDNYMIKCMDNDELHNQVKYIFSQQQQGKKPDCALGQLINLYLAGDFESTESKERFLKIYEELQPYLLKIDHNYDLKYFIRELQTPEDFHSAAEKICNDRVKLQQLIKVTEVAQSDTKQLFAIDKRPDLDKFLTLYHATGDHNNQSRTEFIKVYKELQPFLIQIDDKYDPEYLHQNFKSDLDFLQAIFQIKQDVIKFKDLNAHTEKSILEQDIQVNNSLQALSELYISGDFKNPENQQKFIEIYNKLQPYLNKVNGKYNHTSFIRQLETDQDFYTATGQILMDQSKLPQIELVLLNQTKIIGGLEHAKNLKTQLSKERCDYFFHLLIKQEQEINPEKIRAYKEKVYNDYIDTKIRAQLEDRVGSKHTDLYLKQITPKLQEIKHAILEKITIQDNIKAKIALEIDAAYPKIVKNNEAAFKAKIFDDALKEHFNNQLGIYSTIFIDKMSLPKTDGLQALAVNKNIEQGIQAELIRFIPEIEKNNVNLIQTYTQLERTVKQLDQTIAGRSDNNNPCRTEQTQKLKSLKKNLEEISSKDTIILQQMHETSTLEQAGIIEKYDALADIYGALEVMKKDHLDVSELQQLLSDTTQDPSLRLNTASRKLSSVSPTDNQNIGISYRLYLFKNYINKTIKKQLESELGDFSTKFLQGIKPEFKSHEIINVLLKENEDLNTVLADRIEKVKEDIFAKHAGIKTLYAQLNASLKRIDGNLPPPSSDMTWEVTTNACRKEKIDLLKLYKEKILAIANNPETDQVEFLQTQDSDVKTMLSSMKDYDAMIAAYDGLIKMENYIVKQDKKKPEELNKDKIAEISKMKDMLVRDTKLKPSQRLENVRNRSDSEECEEILLKNSDNFFVWLWKSFLSIFFNWQSKDEQKFGMFRERLHTIEPPAPERVNFICP